MSTHFLIDPAQKKEMKNICCSGFSYRRAAFRFSSECVLCTAGVSVAVRQGMIQTRVTRFECVHFLCLSLV